VASGRHLLTVPAVLTMLLVLLPGLASAAPSVATAGCDPLAPGACTGTQATGGQTVHGWMFVTGREAEADESAKVASDCAGCTWVVSLDCLPDSGAAGPGSEHCAGLYVGCTTAQQRFVVSFSSSPGGQLAQIDTYCYATPDGGVVDAASLNPFVRRYATMLTISQPTMRAWPPGGSSLVGLPTFFAASAPMTERAQIGGRGYTLSLEVDPSKYTWSFGDGATMTTKTEGGPPPDGPTHHTYTTAGREHVAVTIAYGATYTVVTPGGTFGPQPVTGGPLRTLPADLNMQIRDAAAGLNG
jgi:hypothetical protein